MNSIEFSLPGKVFTAKRPRVNTINKQIYSPHKKEITVLKKQIHAQLPLNWRIRKGEVWVEIEAIFRRPKYMLKPSINQQPFIRTPDSDNIAKIYLDSMNGLVYEDDRLIAKLFIFKRYTKPTEPNSTKVMIRVFFPNGG